MRSHLRLVLRCQPHCHVFLYVMTVPHQTVRQNKLSLLVLFLFNDLFVFHVYESKSTRM